MLTPFLPAGTTIYDPCYNDKTAKQNWEDIGYNCVNSNVDFFDEAKRPVLPRNTVIFAKYDLIYIYE